MSAPGHRAQHPCPPPEFSGFGDNGGMNTPDQPHTPSLPPADPQPIAVDTLIHNLGNAGLIPFVGLMLLMWVVNAEALPYVALTMVSYAALIATFLGGIHWGVVWVRQSGGSGIPPLTDEAARHHLWWGITPSLLAWPGMLMPEYAALPWLGVLLLACYAVDRKLLADSGLGHWLTLRFRLSGVAALCCFIAAGAI